MKNKKAFTLIELLAVIIVLSVVVAITVPVVSKSIENSKKNSAIVSAKGLIQSAEYYFLTASPKYGKIDVLNEKLNFKGEKPEIGEIEIDRQGKSRIYTYINGYCVTKEFGTELYANKMNKEDCSWFGTDNYETIDGNIFTLNNQSVKNYLIYGNSKQATRSGKNLLNKADFTTSFTNGYYKNETTGFKLTAGKTYTLSFNYNVNITPTATLSTGVGYGTTQYSTDIIYSKQYPNQKSGRQTVTFTTPTSLADGNYLFIRFARTNTSSSASVDISSVQLEEGSNATAYEEYGVMPSPEFPSEVKSTGDLLTSSNCASYGSDACNNVGKYVIQVKATGKNIFDINGWYNWLRTYTTKYVEKETIDGTEVIRYQPPITYNKPWMKGKFKENTKYVFSYRAKGIVGQNTSTGVKFVYNDGSISACYVANEATWKNYICVSNGKTIDHLEMNYNYGQGCYFDTNSMQLEEGTSATAYESYKGKITNIYLDEPLRNIGDYVDYIDYANGKVVRNVGETIFNGSENWIQYPSTNKYYVSDVLPTIYKSNSFVLSNRFFKRTSGDSSRTDDNKYTYGDGDIWLQSKEEFPRLYIYKNDIATVQNLKTWLSNNNITVVYPLNKSKEESIDLPNIEVLDGYSKLFINTTINPSKVVLTTNK